MKQKKILFRLSVSFLLLTVLALLFAAGGWIWSFRLPPGEMPKSAVLTPPGEVLPGGIVTAAAELRLPLCRTLDEVLFEPGEPTVMTAPPELSFVKYEWRYKVVQLRVRLAALRPGETKTGRLSFRVRRHFDRASDGRLFTVAVPAFMVVEKNLPPGGVKLELADELAPPPPPFFCRRSFWGVMGGAAVLILLFCWWLYRLRHRPLPCVPPWEKALMELHELRFLFEQKRVEAETGIMQLTDLVRRYLEERYGLPVTTETTPEFLNSLERGCGEKLLPEAQKPFLREFLQAADLVRFARAAADRNMVDRAIAQAEGLVESTIPAPEPRAGKGA